MRKIFFVLSCVFAIILSGCSMKNKKIEPEGKYYLKEFYVDVLGSDDGFQYVDYTKRYTKTSCENNTNEDYAVPCEMLLSGDDVYFNVTSSRIAYYMDGVQTSAMYYILRDDYVFYTKDDATDSNMNERGYFFEGGMIFYIDGPGNSEFCYVFEKK